MSITALWDHSRRHSGRDGHFHRCQQIGGDNATTPCPYPGANPHTLLGASCSATRGANQVHGRDSPCYADRLRLVSFSTSRPLPTWNFHWVMIAPCEQHAI